MLKQVIPRKTVYRLSLYYRSLQRLQANNVETVSSAALALTLWETSSSPSHTFPPLSAASSFGVTRRHSPGLSFTALSGPMRMRVSCTTS